MNTDDILYTGLLAFSLLFGFLFRKVHSDTHRKWVGSIVGLFIVILVSGFHTIHTSVLVLITILILNYVDKRYCHVAGFCAGFGYLLFFRLCHYVGLPVVPAHTNAIQMMLTLKMVGMCFEVHDSWKKEGQLKKSEDSDEKEKLTLELKYEQITPVPMEVFHYAYCYLGVLTGPYYKFRVYRDMLNTTHDGDKGADCMAAMIERIRVLPLYAVLFLFSSNYFPLSFAVSSEIFRDYSLLYRIWYMTPVFFTFRMRIYAAFVLSECVCIIAGLGAYPVSSNSKPGQGPSDYKPLELLGKDNQEYDFETIHNIDEWGSDFQPTMRGALRCWNMTVQYWLANNVYRRFKLPRPVREAMTMFTSAFWHGVYPGYYLSMLSVPFVLAVEDYYDRVLRRRLSDTGKYVYDWLMMIMRMQHFSYLGMGFLLLRVDTTIKYWRSIGFIYHGVLVIMHGFAQFINLICLKASHKLQKAKTVTVMNDQKVRLIGTKGLTKDENIPNAVCDEKKTL